MIADAVPVPVRRLVDAALVRRLVASQFPQWADLPVRPVPRGWDNQTFRLGERLSVRLPTAQEYALAVDKEHRWLPVLAPQLPLPVPRPVTRGVPAHGYRFDWSVYEWIDGEPANLDSIGDLTGFAKDLAAFLVALRRVDPTRGRSPDFTTGFVAGRCASTTLRSAGRSRNWTTGYPATSSPRSGSRHSRRPGTADRCGSTATWPRATF